MQPLGVQGGPVSYQVRLEHLAPLSELALWVGVAKALAGGEGSARRSGSCCLSKARSVVHGDLAGLATRAPWLVEALASFPDARSSLLAVQDGDRLWNRQRLPGAG